MLTIKSVLYGVVVSFKMRTFEAYRRVLLGLVSL